MKLSMMKSKTLQCIVVVAIALMMLFSFVPSAHAAAYETLSYGESGSDVTKLQQALHDKGYLSVSPTGYYGWMTEAAVRTFQKDVGLTVDGIAGQYTQTKLFASATGTASLKIGSSGSEVTKLQNRLHTLGYLDYSGSTGYYGSVTKTAVIRFQKNNGLTADGVAGSATTSKLYSSSAKSLVLKIGSSGEAVSALQQKLSSLGFYKYGTITGYYGSVTKDAVVRFQQASGLSADGIAGPATRIKLFSGNVPQAPASSVSKIADIALAQSGKPYVLGDEGPSSYDCSGLIHYAVNNAGFSVKRYSAAVYSEYSAWTKIWGTSSLKKGDIVFFRSDTSANIGHMGVYIGNGEFVHASSGQGRVMVSTLNNTYWARNYVFARRVQ